MLPLGIQDFGSFALKCQNLQGFASGSAELWGLYGQNAQANLQADVDKPMPGNI